MKSLLRSLLSLLFFVCFITGVSAALLFPLSKQRHLALVRVTEMIGPTPPAANTPPAGENAAAAPSLTVQHHAAGVVDGELMIAHYLADNEGQARLHVPNPEGLAPSPGFNLRIGVPQQTFLPGSLWSRDHDAFVLRLPLLWIAIIGLSVAVVGYGSRTLYRLFTTERKPSAVCLHCNHRYEDFDADVCPSCSATRSRVTVSKVGRPV